MNILLNSGGKDSNFSGKIKKFINCFVFIKNCNTYIENKYAFLNNKILKKKIFSVNLSIEYFFIIKKKLNLNINIDYYCNKLIKIYLIKKILNIKILFTAHYFKRIKNFFFFSNDQKKDQNYFLNYKNNIYSIIGYYNKNIIKYISYKNFFLCFKKKSTVNVCFNIVFKKKIFFILIENKMIFNIKLLKNNINLGKKIFSYNIIKKKKNFLIISKYLIKNDIIKIININFIKKNINFKLNSQNVKKIGKIVIFNKNCYIIFYKKIFFLEKNILLFYNDLIINNIKIKKKN